MARFSLLFIAGFLATPAFADVEIRFDEGAPKDRFAIVNQGGCPTGPMTLTLDLAASAGRLIFDVTEAGAGVQVYQPFELVAGADIVTSTPQVLDGDRGLVLAVSDMMPGELLSFTIDVDDTMGAREITVSDAEIEGAVVRADVAGQNVQARFGRDARAVLTLANCLS